MSLRDQITDEMKSALKAGDKARLSTLRLISAAVKDRDIAARAEDRCAGCDDAEIMAILQKLAKQREESAETYEKAGPSRPRRGRARGSGNRPRIPAEADG